MPGGDLLPLAPIESARKLPRQAFGSADGEI